MAKIVNIADVRVARDLARIAQDYYVLGTPPDVWMDWELAAIYPLTRRQSVRELLLKYLRAA